MRLIFDILDLTAVDGNYCITGGSDKTVKLWNPHKKLMLQSYSGHGNDVLAVDSSFDSSQIASAGIDKMLFIWDVSEGQPVRRIRAHAAQINAVRYNEESTVLATGSTDGMVNLWDMKSRNNQPIQALEEAKDSVTSIFIFKHEILTGSLDGKVRIYDLRNGMMHVDDVSGKFGPLKLPPETAIKKFLLPIYLKLYALQVLLEVCVSQTMLNVYWRPALVIA